MVLGYSVVVESCELRTRGQHKGKRPLFPVDDVSWLQNDWALFSRIGECEAPLQSSALYSLAELQSVYMEDAWNPTGTQSHNKRGPPAASNPRAVRSPTASPVELDGQIKTHRLVGEADLLGGRYTSSQHSNSSKESDWGIISPIIQTHGIYTFILPTQETLRSPD